MFISRILIYGLPILICFMAGFCAWESSGRTASARSLVRQAEEAYHWGNRETALQQLDSAIALAPNCSEAYLQRGIIHLVNGARQDAISDFGSVVKLKPDCAVAYMNRAQCRYSEGDHKGAREDLAKSIELEPTFAGFNLSDLDRKVASPLRIQYP